MNIVLWVVASLLALAFIGAGRDEDRPGQGRSGQIGPRLDRGLLGRPGRGPSAWSRGWGPRGGRAGVTRDRADPRPDRGDRAGRHHGGARCSSTCGARRSRRPSRRPCCWCCRRSWRGDVPGPTRCRTTCRTTWARTGPEPGRAASRLGSTSRVALAEALGSMCDPLASTRIDVAATTMSRRARRSDSAPRDRRARTSAPPRAPRRSRSSSPAGPAPRRRPRRRRSEQTCPDGKLVSPIRPSIESETGGRGRWTRTLNTAPAPHPASTTTSAFTASGVRTTRANSARPREMTTPASVPNPRFSSRAMPGQDRVPSVLYDLTHRQIGGRPAGGLGGEPQHRHENQQRDPRHKPDHPFTLRNLLVSAR